MDGDGHQIRLDVGKDRFVPHPHSFYQEINQKIKDVLMGGISLVKLKEINQENWLDVIRLSSGEDQKNKIIEQFIASNCLSIAQASIQKGWVTKAIYNDETLIGFTMYGYSEELKGFEVCRLMIDYHFQGQGLGKEALKCIVSEMQKQFECEHILICFVPENFKAKKLYESIGFTDTGRMAEGEVVYSLKCV